MPKKTRAARQAAARRRPQPRPGPAPGTRPPGAPPPGTPNGGPGGYGGPGADEEGPNGGVGLGDAEEAEATAPARTGSLPATARRVGRVDPATARRTKTQQRQAAAGFAPLDPDDPAIPFDRVPYVPADLRRVAIIGGLMVLLIVVAAIIVTHTVS
jgi:hypothetical protein